jgi:hypothetical protein
MPISVRGMRFWLLGLFYALKGSLSTRWTILLLARLSVEIGENAAGGGWDAHFFLICKI